MKPGDKIKFTRGSIRFSFDNLWKREVTPYHLPIFAIVLDRSWTPVVTKVTEKYMYQNRGRDNNLHITIMGFALHVRFHFSEPKQERVKIT